MKTGKKHGYVKTFEEFKKDVSSKIEEIFLGIKNKVEGWFKTGALSKEKNVQLSECKMNTSSTQPSITFEFSGVENYFEVILKGDMENLSGDDAKTFLLEIKRFEIETAELLDRKESEISDNDLTEDYFLQLIAKSGETPEQDQEITANNDNTAEPTTEIET